MHPLVGLGYTRGDFGQVDKCRIRIRLLFRFLNENLHFRLTDIYYDLNSVLQNCRQYELEQILAELGKN